MSDAAELEREAEAARARLSDTADQIRAKMSPGQMMDEVLNQFRGGDGSQMFANLRGQARDNPMALALVGSGLAWLMMGSGSQADAPARPSASPSTGDWDRDLRHQPAGGLSPGRLLRRRRVGLLHGERAGRPCRERLGSRIDRQIGRRLGRRVGHGYGARCFRRPRLRPDGGGGGAARGGRPGPADGP